MNLLFTRLSKRYFPECIPYDFWCYIDVEKKLASKALVKALPTSDVENLIVEVTSKVTLMIYRSEYNNNMGQCTNLLSMRSQENKPGLWESLNDLWFKERLAIQENKSYRKSSTLSKNW